MSAIIALTLDDSQATPVSHTFDPKINLNGLIKWKDSDSSIVSNLRPQISITMREASSKVSRKITAKVAVPYQPATIDSVTPAVRTTECICTILIPDDAPAIAITDLTKYVSNVLSQTPIVDAVENGNFPY